MDRQDELDSRALYSGRTPAREDMVYESDVAATCRTEAVMAAVTERLEKTRNECCGQ